MKSSTKYYVCPMHSEVHREHPGVCGKCGMRLIPASKEHAHHTGTSDLHNKHAGHSPDMFRQKFWGSTALTIPILLFSNSIQSWLHYELSFPGSQYIPALFGIILFWYGGIVFLKSATAEIRGRQPGMMTLISMAITVAFGYSLAITANLTDGMDFWWELATLITIMIFGHWMEMSSIQNAQGALHELSALLPDKAEVVTHAGIKTLMIGDVKIGDLLLVRPGAKVPADGIVTKGESYVNESMLTGESKAVKKISKSKLVGGTINGDGSLTMRVTNIGDGTALAGIMHLVAEAQNSKSKVQILADRAAFYLTFIAIGSALITLIGWTFFTNEPASFVLSRVVTVLIIACPHALGLAIPLVVAISTNIAARNGLLIRQRLALEAARNVDIVLFDKTGTLTKGEQGVTDVWSTDEYSTTDILRLAASLEQQSEHSIGKAITKRALEQGLELDDVRNFSAIPGFGVRGVLRDDSKTYIAASKRYVNDNKLTIPRKLVAASVQAAKDGKTEVYLLNNDVVIGVLALTDQIRDESREAIDELKSMGIATAMITGDSMDVAAYVARELQLDQFFAEVRPEDKSAKVSELQTAGKRVAMVGDGVNDAPALIQAEIGIAIGAGTDVAIESAGIVLVGSDPRGVVKVVKLSRATYHKMQQNLAWATGYNALAIPLAAGVTASFGFVLSPAIGAILMSLSTIIVALNAQMLRRLKLDTN